MIDMRNVVHIESPTNWDANYRQLSWVRSNHNIPSGGQAVFPTSYQFARGRMYILTVEVPNDINRNTSGFFFSSVYGSWGSSNNSITGVAVKYESEGLYVTNGYEVEAGIDLTGGNSLNTLQGLWSIGEFNTTSFPNNTKRAVWLKMPSSGSCTFGVNTPVADGFTPVLQSDTLSYHDGPQGNIAIGGLHFTDGHTSEVKRLKIYRFRIFSGDENGQLLSDLVPAQRKFDGVIGLYDILNGNFFPTDKQDENDIGPTYDENPLWSPGVSYRKSVVKIETYKNGNLIQLWPCYSAGPTNPNPPVVGNAFDYDDNITWTVGTGVENEDGYYYYPITATGQANGIQIAVADNPNGWNSDGKPSSGTTYTWKIQAERAGYYQMIMSAKMSSAEHITTGNWSNLNLQVNGSTSGVLKLSKYGDTPDFTNVDYNDVVVAIVPLSGYIDSVTFQQSSYRIVVDPTSNLIFREIDATSPAYITLDTTNAPTEFTQGDTFSYSGLVVTQTLANGTTSTLSSGYTVSTPDMSTTGTKTVTVTYGDLTASYEIAVSASGYVWTTTATLTNSDTKLFEQGTCGGSDAVRIPILNFSSGGFGSDGRVSSTSTDEVYKITPPSAGDYMLILPIRRGSGNPQWNINGGSSFTVAISNTTFEYIEILYPITLTAGENTLTIRNSSYRCYFDTTDSVYLVKSSTNPFS